MTRTVALAALMLMIAGCTSTPRTVSAPRMEAPKVAQFATEIAGPGTYLAPMPTAVVLLTPDDMARNRAFCAAVSKLPTVAEASAGSVVAPNLILTRWLVQVADVAPEKAKDCEFLVGTYDYNRAARMIGSLQSDGAALVGHGPYLAMIIPDTNGQRMLAVDGSVYTAAQFDRFVVSWKDSLDKTQTALASRSNQPGLVRSVFNLAAAVLRTVFGASAGLIQGAVAGV
jgi:hypothetical protein